MPLNWGKNITDVPSGNLWPLDFLSKRTWEVLVFTVGENSEKALWARAKTKTTLTQMCRPCSPRFKLGSHFRETSALTTTLSLVAIEILTLLSIPWYNIEIVYFENSTRFPQNDNLHALTKGLRKSLTSTSPLSSNTMFFWMESAFLQINKSIALSLKTKLIPAG